MDHLDIDPAAFLMIGNSLKYDVLPALTIGRHAYHVPYPITWDYEYIDEVIEHPNFRQFAKLTEVLHVL